MAQQFSDTVNRTGIIQSIERLTNTQSASTSSYPLTEKTVDVNNAFAKYITMAISTSGRWQVDDTNHTKYPVITTNLVANQQDYTFTVDEQLNQILDIYRVEVMDESGIFHVVSPISQEDIKGVAMSEFMKTAAQPFYYDKTANGIFLYAKSSYNATNGLKIYFARTPSYFVSTDTTKVPGIPDIHHEYLSLRPSYFYCLAKGLKNVNNYKVELMEMEANIKEYYRDRSKDDKPYMRTVTTSSR